MTLPLLPSIIKAATLRRYYLYLIQANCEHEARCWFFIETCIKFLTFSAGVVASVLISGDSSALLEDSSKEATKTMLNKAGAELAKMCFSDKSHPDDPSKKKQP